MKKSMRLLIFVLVTISLVSFLLREQIGQKYYDFKASRLVGTCYNINDNNMPGSFKIIGYQELKFNIEGVALMMVLVEIKFKGSVPSEALFESIKNQELSETSCGN